MPMSALRRKPFVLVGLIALGIVCIAASVAIVLGARSSKGPSKDSFSKTRYLHTGALSVPVPCFREPRTYRAGASGSDTLAVVDFDGDRRPDLAAANPDGDSVSVLMNSGGGTFVERRAFPVGKRPYALAAGELNGDLSPDLVTANANSSTVSVLIGRLGALADVNGDGKLDLMSLSARTVSVLLSLGAGRFAAGVHYRTGDGPTSVALATSTGTGPSISSQRTTASSRRASATRSRCFSTKAMEPSGVSTTSRPASIQRRSRSEMPPATASRTS